MNAACHVRIDGISPREQVGLPKKKKKGQTTADSFIGTRSGGTAYLFDNQAAHAMGDQDDWGLVPISICQVGASPATGMVSPRLVTGTYIAVLSQVRRVVQVCQESLAEVVDGQRALLRLGPVRVVAKGMDADVSEAGLERQPLLGPEGGRVRRRTPRPPRSAVETVHLGLSGRARTCPRTGRDSQR